MKTKLHLIIMSLFLLFVAGGQSVCLAADSWSYPTSKPKTPFGGGDGSQGNPYRIETAQHLANLAYMVTDKNTTYKKKYFILTNDITLNDDVLNDKGTGLKNDESSYKLWTPIGEYGRLYDDYFMGIFDGKGHTIRGMVCINPDGERRYNGFFGTTDDATIMNLNLEDCYLASNDVDGIEQNYGSLVGVTRNTTFKDCHVSKTLVKVNYNYNGFTDDTFCCVGGMIGQLDLPRWNVASSYKTHLTNCSFKGNIDVTVHKFLSVRVGGLFAYQYKDPAFAAQYLYLANCNTEGNINIYSTYSSNKIYVGGVTSAPGRGGNEIKNCVNRMNITVDGEMDFCRITGFGDFWEANDRYKVSQCVCSGTIKVGSESNKAKISGLEIYGFICNDRSFLRNCAFYGKYDIHSQGSYVYITPLCDDLYVEDSEVPGVVCSVGNVFDLDYKNSPNLDQVSNKTITLDKDNKEQPAKHKVYYHFEYTGGVTFPCNGTADASKYNKSLDEMKTDDFIKTLNTDAGSNVWGKMTGMNDESLNGLPMPVACGGMVTEYSGTGTLSDPYIINNEYDIKRLMESVNNGSSFEGIYFKLGSDIYGGNLTSIGESSDNPFKGHFDGNGHAIIGLRRCLFGYMYGTVKNLTLLEADISSVSDGAILAMYIGNGEGSVNAEISNCYVSGTVNVKKGWSEAITAIGGLCNHIYAGSKVHDCYFKGTLQASNDLFSGNYMAAGIAVFNNNKNGIYNCYASFDVKQSGGFIGGSNVYGISDYGMSNCYAIAPTTRTDSGCTLLNAEAELSASALGDQWIQGLYRPVLKGTKYYEVTTPEGDISYLDGIPAEVVVEEGEVANAACRANASGTDENGDALKSNYITCYVPKSEEELHDVILWSLPNVAIYSDEYKADVIPNFYLDNRKDLKYTPTTGATKAMGAMYYPLQPNSTGWHMLCLPGFVTKDLFPEGSSLFVVDGVDNDAMMVQVSEVDTISPATPFIAYIPLEAEDVSLVSFGDLVFTPRTASATSPLMGTFSNTTQSDCATELSADGKTLLHSIVCDIKPFQAWLPGVKGDIAISSTPTGIKLIGRDSDGNERIYNLRGIEMKTEKGIYIKGGKVRVKK